MLCDSWLPRARCMCWGYSHLYAKSVKMTSALKEPLSTKSPAGTGVSQWTMDVCALTRCITCAHSKDAWRSPARRNHTVEEVRLLRGRLAVELKDVEQVIELAVDVSAYCERLSCGFEEGGRLDDDGNLFDVGQQGINGFMSSTASGPSDGTPVGTSTSTSVASDLRAASAPMTISNAKRTLIFFWSLNASSMLSTNCCVIL
jgi:hypothetical protein